MIEEGKISAGHELKCPKIMRLLALSKIALAAVSSDSRRDRPGLSHPGKK